MLNSSKSLLDVLNKISDIKWHEQIIKLVALYDYYIQLFYGCVQATCLMNLMASMMIYICIHLFIILYVSL